MKDGKAIVELLREIDEQLDSGKCVAGQRFISEDDERFAMYEYAHSIDSDICRGCGQYKENCECD